MVDKVDDFCLYMCSTGKVSFDPFYDICYSYVESGKAKQIDVICELAAVAYRTGAIGIKLNPQDRFIYGHIDNPLVSPKLITLSSKVRLHPMLHAAFNLQER